MEFRPDIVAAYQRLGGNISAVARELTIQRSTVRRHVAAAGADKRPIAGGSIVGIEEGEADLPKPGEVFRWIVTSAQNNTRVHDKVWANLMALADHYKAAVLVGTFSYNKNAYGKLAVKRDTKDPNDADLWYDDRLTEYLCDERLALGNGLVWCGEMNIQPTAADPLEGLETYSGRKSAIFPHAKIAMRSIPAMPGEGVKLNYTTGTVTQRNYIAKKAGLVAEHHHTYGGLLVEVDSDGHWWVRQLDADENGDIQDLDVRVHNGKVTAGHHVEAITWGDHHFATADAAVEKTSVGPGGMLDALRPVYQFHHDVMEGVGTNHHGANNPHDRFVGYLRGFHKVEEELRFTAERLGEYHRPLTKSVVVDSNHDGQWLARWLRENDYRRDPANAELFLEMQLAYYRELRAGRKLNLVEWGLRRHRVDNDVQFLGEDESFTICGGRIECGMHGHLGPNGARGTPQNLSKIGRRANTGHTHSAGIYNGLYVAGTSTTLSMGYNKGPSSWTHSHIVTYPNGKRAIVTVYAGKWRAA